MRKRAPSPASGVLVASARDLRRRQTPSEELLWSRLRRGQLGVPFRRQHVVGPFVVDFCCPAAGLIVEVDGAVHSGVAARTQDEWREDRLREMGYRVLRFTTTQVEADLDLVVGRIRDELEQDRPGHRNVAG